LERVTNYGAVNTKARAHATLGPHGERTVTVWSARLHNGHQSQLSEDAARSLLADLRAYFRETADAPYLVN